MAKESFKAGGALWKGSLYKRGGNLHDKHGNTYKVPITYRDNKSGLIVNSKGNLLGIEQNREHSYAMDAKRVKLSAPQSRRKRAMMASLRRRGKV